MSNFYLLANHFNLANCILDLFKIGFTFPNLIKLFIYFINKYIKVYIERYFIRLTCELIYRKLNHYLLSFILNLFKCKNNLLEDKINFALDELIFDIDKDIKHISPLILVIFGYIFIFINQYYVYSDNITVSFLFTYLYKICFMIGILIELINITKDLLNNCKLKDNYFKLYKIIRYFLFGLLFINLIAILVIFFFFINYLINLIYNVTLNWLVKIKGSLPPAPGPAHGHNFFKGDYNKPPKKPENTSSPMFTYKKKHKDIIKRASSMKEKIINIQKDKLLNNENVDINSSGSGRLNRKWEHTIVIEENLKLSLKEQQGRVENELKAYYNQKKKFKNIIDKIKKGKENFYPDESKFLFKDYIKVINNLNANLKSMKTTLKKQEINK